MQSRELKRSRHLGSRSHQASKQLGQDASPYRVLDKHGTVGGVEDLGLWEASHVRGVDHRAVAKVVRREKRGIKAGKVKNHDWRLVQPSVSGVDWVDEIRRLGHV